MLVIGLILSIAGLGFLAWLLFTLAVCALPFFAAVTVGLFAFHSGAGVIGAFIVAVLVGGGVWAIGQVAFATVRAPLVRAAIALLFTAPAAIAGYQATLGLAQIGMPAEGWRQAFAIVGALVVGGTAWARITHYAPPGGIGQGAASGEIRSPGLAATNDG